MSDIFISYASEDGAIAQRLAAVLEEHGWSTFWDRCVPAGRTWRDFIGGKLEAARCVLVVWSEASSGSDYVQEEADEGRERRVLIPVLIDNVRPPFGFRPYHAADLPGWVGREKTPSLKQLIADIEGLIGRPSKVDEKQESVRLLVEAPAKSTEPLQSGTEEISFQTGTQETDNFAPLSIFRDRLRRGSEGPEMVVLPAGDFLMGLPDSDGEASVTEKPQHCLQIPKPFAVGRYPVTFEEYDQFAHATYQIVPKDEGWGRGRRPVINVSWDDAKAFVAWLGEETGKEYRLLSEAEWEYAARAGTTTPFSFGDEISEKDTNFRGNLGKTSEVGSYSANAWNLHDMHGNVWEWVEDCWNDSYEGAPTDQRAWTTGSCDFRILRGGSWNSRSWVLRSAFRNGIRTRDRNLANGFRVARALP